MIALGIDPGLKGGLVWVEGISVPVLTFMARMPVRKKRKIDSELTPLDVVKLLEMFGEAPCPDVVVHEQPMLRMKKDRNGKPVSSITSIVSGWNQMGAMGAALLARYGEVETLRIQPAGWQRYTRGLIGDTKERALRYALIRLKDSIAEEHAALLTKYDGLSDAACLAIYGWDTLKSTESSK